MAQEEEEDWDDGMDCETFIESQGIDDDAANALRSCSKELFGRIVAQGPLTGENPSALVMARIRDEGNQGVEDPEEFLAAVDDRAREVFIELHEDVRRIIMDDGPLIGHNPSAILMGRCRKAKDASKKPVGAGSGRAAERAAAQQPGVKVVVKKKAARAAQSAAVGAAGAESGRAGGAALHCLGTELCQLNAAFWDFDVSRADVMASMTAILDTREAAAAEATTAWEEWPAAREPPKKRMRQSPAAAYGSEQRSQDAPTSDADQEGKREAVLAEVLRMLEEAGGHMTLQDMGSKHLTDLRKGAVANLSKFLSSRPDLLELTSSFTGSPLVRLL